MSLNLVFRDNRHFLLDPQRNHLGSTLTLQTSSSLQWSCFTDGHTEIQNTEGLETHQLVVSLSKYKSKGRHSQMTLKSTQYKAFQHLAEPTQQQKKKKSWWELRSPRPNPESTVSWTCSGTSTGLWIFSSARQHLSSTMWVWPLQVSQREKNWAES